MRWMYVHNDMALSILNAWVARISQYLSLYDALWKIHLLQLQVVFLSSHALLQIIMDIVMSRLCECLSSISVMINFCYALLHKTSWN